MPQIMKMDKFEYHLLLTKEEEHNVVYLTKKYQNFMNCLQNKEIQCLTLSMNRINEFGEVEDKVQAFLTLDEENARETAKKLDEKLGTDESKGLLIWNANWCKR